MRVRALNDSVVAVHIAGAIPQRGAWTERTDAADLVETVVRAAAIEEVWLHGQLYPSDAPSTARDHRGWLARVEGSELAITPMIGRPKWASDESDLPQGHA